MRDETMEHFKSHVMFCICVRVLLGRPLIEGTVVAYGWDYDPSCSNLAYTCLTKNKVPASAKPVSEIRKTPNSVTNFHS